MARRVRTRGSRVTPKGTGGPTASGRYTPPIPKEYKESPRWVAVLMFAALILGMLVIVLNYLGVFGGGEADNIWLIAGLGLISVGFVVATRLH